jgi:two-component system LytT family response regulator
MEADGKYTYIYVEDRKPYYSSYHLKHFEEHLDESKFFRIHRSAIINLDKVKRIYQKFNLIAELSDGKEIVISRRNRVSFLAALEANKG